MVQLHDVSIDGAGYMLLPGGYKYEVGGAEIKTFRTGVSTFAARLGPPASGPVVIDQDKERWYAFQMMPIPIGIGSEMGRMVLAPGEVQYATGLGSNFDQNSVVQIYNGVVYFSIGANLYKVNTTSGAFTSVTLIGAAGGTITGMAVISNLLYMATTAAGTMSNYAGSGAIANTPAAPAQKVWAYAQGIWRSKGNDPTTISGSIDGGATWTQWQLDSAVKSVTSWRGRATGGGVTLIATQYMLWELAGQWTGSPAAFSGTVSPLYDGRGGGAADDFQYLVEYQGNVYTQYAGSVHRWDGVSLLPMPGGPRGQIWGMCVAGDYLCVSMKDLALATWDVWLFDGARWFALVRSAGVAYNQLAGTGGLITDGHLLSLDWITATISRWELPVLGFATTPRTSGQVMVGPLDAGMGDAIKNWTSLVCTFSTALYESGGSAPANPGGNLLLEYSVDDGVNWLAAGTQAVAAGARSGLYQPALPASVDAARLTVRATWTPTSSYAGLQIDGLWASGFAIVDAPKEEHWTLKLRCTDKMIRRDGSVDARSGETQLAALRALAQAGRIFTFLDLDYDLSARSVVARVTGLAETERKGDGAHFMETTVTLGLSAVS